MMLRILIVGIISVILQACANYGNFNTQKYTNLRFNKSIVATSDTPRIQNDSINYTDEIEDNFTTSEICIEEIITFEHKENSQPIIDERWVETKEKSSKDITKYSISEVITEKIVTEKREHSNKGEKAYGWLLYSIGGALLLSGVVAPLFAALIGWWIILIAVASIFLGAFLMIVGSQKTGSHSEEFTWSGVLALFYGLICFGITSIVGIIILIV